LFQAVMLAAQHRLGDTSTDTSVPIVEPTRDLKEHTVCELSGMLAGAACPVRLREWLPRSFSELPCDWHHASDDGLLTIWPAEYRQWAHAHGYAIDVAQPERKDRPALARSESRPAPRQGFTIVSPASGATYLIDPTLRLEFQSVALRAVSGRGPVEWRIDGKLYATNRGGDDVQWPLRRGQHRIAARDTRGEEAEVMIVVK
jgi:membrane carboxypeptidase/penicillin-binding protein PbpC